MSPSPPAPWPSPRRRPGPPRRHWKRRACASARRSSTTTAPSVSPPARSPAAPTSIAPAPPPTQRVEAVLDAYPDWKIPAHVITAVPTADRQKATVRVRIAFDQKDARILPDMGVKVSFITDEASAAVQTT